MKEEQRSIKLTSINGCQKKYARSLSVCSSREGVISSIIVLTRRGMKKKNEAWISNHVDDSDLSVLFSNSKADLKVNQQGGPSRIGISDWYLPIGSRQWPVE